MNLYRKLLLAQAPIAIALALVGIFSVVVVSYLGSHSQTILKDNYRSVLAAQRMKEAIERMDSGALFIVAGERQKGHRAGGKKSADLRSRAESAGGQYHRGGRKGIHRKTARRVDRLSSQVCQAGKKRQRRRSKADSTSLSWNRPFTR